MSRTGQNIIYQDFSRIYKLIVYSKSKRLELLDLLTKKGELHHLCSENKNVEQLDGNHTTNQCLCCSFVVAKTVFFSLDAAYNQLYFGCAVCSSCLNFA